MLIIVCCVYISLCVCVCVYVYVAVTYLTEESSIEGPEMSVEMYIFRFKKKRVKFSI